MHPKDQDDEMPRWMTEQDDDRGDDDRGKRGGCMRHGGGMRYGGGGMRHGGGGMGVPYGDMRSPCRGCKKKQRAMSWAIVLLLLVIAGLLWRRR